MKLNIALLPGDGIGPEVIEQACSITSGPIPSPGNRAIFNFICTNLI